MASYYGYFILGGLLSVVGMLVSGRLKAKFNKYRRIGISTGMSGREVAQAMLQHYGILDVQIVQGKGMLTDHYNPATKTVSLSPEIYSGRSVMSAAVAAHECGHAVQHATSYAWLQFRSKMVPLVQLSATAQQFLIIIAFMTLSTMPQLMLITLITFAITALFSLVTLPVEFDASKRALAWLDASNTLRGSEYDGAKDALHWAAMTYVSAALSALVIVIYLLLQYMAATRD